MEKVFGLTERDFRRIERTVREVERMTSTGPRRQKRSSAATAGTGVAVYKVHTLHATAGQYNCYLQTWASAAWANANTTDVICKITLETAHELKVGDFVIAIGAADAGGIVPVAPMGYAYYYEYD